jgi:hypothetical protein
MVDNYCTFGEADKIQDGIVVDPPAEEPVEIEAEAKVLEQCKEMKEQKKYQILQQIQEMNKV